MVLRNNQKKKVSELTKICFDILDNKKIDNKIFFSAPTGSGKTFILSNVCWKLINKYDKIVIFFTSLSTGGIEKQNFESYLKYRKNSFEIIDEHFCFYLKNEKNIKSATIKDIKNIYKFSDKNKQIYFLGTQQFTKSSILFRENILKGALDYFVEKDYKIIYIRDEAHISKDSIHDKVAPENLNNLFDEYSNCSIFCSATINSLLSNSNTIVFDEKEAIDDCLIKDNLNSFFGIEENSTITSEKLVNICINNFIKQKELYRNLKEVINPALLIQIPSKNGIHDEVRERFLINYLIGKLKDNNLNFVVWCDEFYDDIDVTNVPEIKGKCNDYIREYISKNNSIIDVIIFKVALATGWNIPRANTLLQLRELHSDDLNIQTIGRIRRNPLSNLDDIKEKEFNFCSKYYIYTNNVNSKIQLKQISLKKDFYKYKIKHLKSFKKTIDVNWEKLKIDLNLFLEKNVKIENLKNDIAKHLKIQRVNNINIEVITNQFYWLNEFYKFFSEKLENTIFLFFKDLIDKWISDKNIGCYKHKIYKKLISEFQDIISIINTNINLSIDDNFEYDEHSLPRITQVELVLKSKNNSAFSSARTTLDINKYLAKCKDIHKKWSYNEVVTIINEWKLSNALNIDAIQLDSHGEYECCSSIFDWITSNDINFKNTIFFTKHYISSSLIKYPYVHSSFNEIIKIHNTYPDFILVLNKNDQDIYLVIEVKSKKNDYDLNKTHSIKKMFSEISKLEYFKNYYFCVYLYDDSRKSNSKIEVYSNNKILSDEFSDINSLLKVIMG